MAPKFSIVMPVYNREKFLPTTIKSLLDQTFQDFEIIIVDDYSTDNSLAIANDSKKITPKIKVIALDKNSGVAAARAEGNRHALGEYIVVSDSDDISLPNRLEVADNFLSKNTTCDVFYSNMELLDTETGLVSTRFFQPFVRDLLYIINFIPNSSSAYRRSAYERLGGYDKELRISEDYDLWLQFADTGSNFGYDQTTTVRASMHPGSVRIEEKNKHRNFINTVRSKHSNCNNSFEKFKKLANKETFEFFSRDAKKELWF